MDCRREDDMDLFPKLPRGVDLLLGATFALCGLALLAAAALDVANGAWPLALLHSFWGLTLLSLSLMPGVLRRDLGEVLRDRRAVPRPATALQLAGLLCLGLWLALRLAGQGL